MANINNNSGFSGQGLDLARVYGLDDTMNNTRQDLDNLTGYNFNQAQSTQTMDNERIRSQQASMNDNNMANNSRQNNNENMESNARQINSENMMNSDINTCNNENATNTDMNNANMNIPNNENMNNTSINTLRNENMTNNMTTESGMNNIQQRMTGMQDNLSRQENQRIQQLMPQRQEQTLPPDTREPVRNNMQISGQGLQMQVQSMGNMNSFLRNQIGKNVSVQFLIGTNTLIEKSGVLLGLGSNYIILRENGSGDILVCDFDDVKFIRFESENIQGQM